MPIYEYVCRACGAEMEKLQRVSEEPLRECPECKEQALTKKISAAGFRLKGGGWYVTDFRGDKPKGESSKEDKPSKETASKEKDKGKKAESKPAKQETKKQAGAGG